MRIAEQDTPTWMELSLKNHNLARAVKTIFGSLRQALLEIGVTPPPRRKRK